MSFEASWSLWGVKVTYRAARVVRTRAARVVRSAAALAKDEADAVDVLAKWEFVRANGPRLVSSCELLTFLGQQKSRHLSTVGVPHLQTSAQVAMHWQKPVPSRQQTHTSSWHVPLLWNWRDQTPGPWSHLPLLLTTYPQNVANEEDEEKDEKVADESQKDDGHWRHEKIRVDFGLVNNWRVSILQRVERYFNVIHFSQNFNVDHLGKSLHPTFLSLGLKCPLETVNTHSSFRYIPENAQLECLNGHLRSYSCY